MSVSDDDSEDIDPSLQQHCLVFISYNTNVNQELTKFETPSSSASLKFHSTSCKVSWLLLKYFSFKVVDC